MSKEFELPDDVLGRGTYIDFLTKYLSEITEPFVINIDSGWGAGKTYFIKSWVNKIEKTYATVYVNVWESDFSDDPLLAIMSEVDEQLREVIPDNKEVKKGLKDIVTKSGSLFKAIAPSIAKGLVKKIVGEDGVTALEEATADSIEKLVAKSLAQHRDTHKAINDFKLSLNKFIQDLNDNSDLESPLFVFIDELDRCRPTYAIEVLENIKHIFDVPGVIFVIATDTSQLVHSIRAVYGEGFDATTYLRRFFNREYALPNSDYVGFARMLVTEYKYKGEDLNIFPDDGISERVDDIVRYFSLFAEFFNLKLRDQEQCFARFDAIIKSARENEIINIPYMFFLIMLRTYSKELYAKWFTEKTFETSEFKSKTTIMFYQKMSAHVLIEKYRKVVFKNSDELIRMLSRENVDDAVVNIASSVHRQFTSISTYKNKVDLAGAIL